jgi:glycosyltransferase involved in cell wall biosynthesis
METGGLSVVPLRLRGDLNPICTFRMLRFFRRERIQLVVCNMDREVRTLGAAARLAGGTVFVRRRGSDYAFKNRLRFRLTYRHLVDKVLVNSESTRNTILRENPWMPRGKLHRIYNGIPLGEYYPSAALRESARGKLGYGEEEFVAGMAGSLLPRKRHLTLIRAAADLSNRIPGLRLLFVGTERDPGYSEELRKSVASLGLEGAVDFNGPETDMNLYYNAMDVLVMPSGNEGFGYAAAEAMAAGIPVIVSDASSLPEVVGSDGTAGLVFPLDDHAVLAALLEKLHLDPGLRASVAGEGRRRVQDLFGLDMMVRETEEFFRILTGSQ